MSSIWEDVAQSVMDTMQSYAVTGSFTGSLTRNASPYFKYGDVNFTLIPGNSLPCVRWRKTKVTWEPARSMGGLSTAGTLGTWYTTYEIRVYANNEEELSHELSYMFQSIKGTEAPYPPISDISVDFLNQGSVDSNRKETALMTVTFPIALSKPVLTESVTILTASFTGSIASGSVTTPYPYFLRRVEVTSGSLGHGILYSTGSWQY